MSDSFRDRRRPTHLPVRTRHGRTTIVLITVCTDRRRPLLAHPDTARLLTRVWQGVDDWLVGRYVLLPDHLHAFCVPSGPQAPELKRWVRYWKSLVSRAWPRPAEQPIWQPDFWDRQIRSGAHFGRRWEYVWNNPVRHGLVDSPADWPYQGEVHRLVFEDR